MRYFNFSIFCFVVPSLSVFTFKIFWLKFFFSVFNSNILVSIDLSIMNRTISTSLFCPILCTLSIACYSTAGFHQGSIKNTLFAATKLSPTPAVFKDTKNILTEGSYWNAFTIFVLYLWVLLPYIRWVIKNNYHIFESVSF